MSVELTMWPSPVALEARQEQRTRCLAWVSDAVTAYGGTVLRVVDDAVVAVFGLARAREDDALRAVRAAAQLRDKLPDLASRLDASQPAWAAPPTLRIGVATSDVVVGEDVPGHPLVTGPAVEVATALASAAAPGEVLLGLLTPRLVRDAVTGEVLPPLSDTTALDRFDVWRLLAVLPPVPERRRGSDGPLVDRHAELQALSDVLRQVREQHRGTVVLVLGPAGVGKSRLLAELAATAAAGALVRARCVDHGEGMTLAPVAEMVHQAAGVPDTAGPLAVHAALLDRLGDLPEARPIADRAVGALLGPEGDECALAEALAALLRALARSAPLLVVVEDLHWADAALLDLLEDVAVATRESPVLLCCTARSEFLDERPAWHGGPMGAVTLPLEPLPPPETRQLVDALLAGYPGAEAARARVADAAAGNPLYVEELVAMLLDEGLLARIEDRWVASDLSRLTIPPTITALIASRLDRLPSGERAVLERASVVGKLFYQGAVEALTPAEERPALAERLHRLVRKDLIRAETDLALADAGFRFRHPLIRETAYRGLTQRNRGELHERCATWLEHSGARRLAEYDELVGYHLEQACRARIGLGAMSVDGLELALRAAAHLAAAGRGAFRRRDMGAAVGLLSRAAALLFPEDPARLALLPDLAAACIEVGDLERAGALLSEALTIAEAQGSAAVVEQARRVQAVLNGLLGPPEMAARPGAPVPSPAAPVPPAPVPAVPGPPAPVPAVPDPPAAGRGGTTGEGTAVGAGWTLISGAPAPGRRRGQRSATLSAGVVASAFDPLAIRLVLDGTPTADAVARCTAALAELHDDPTGRARTAASLAGLLALQGRADESRSLLAEARATLEALGLRLRAAALAFVAGMVELLDDRPEAADGVLRPAIAAAEPMGERLVVGGLLALRARAAHDAGRYAEAAELAARADALAPPGEAATHAMARGVRGLAAVRLGQPDDGLDLLREAVWTVEGTELLNVHADALRDLGEGLLRSGREDDAVLASARELYVRKGNAVGLRRLEHSRPQP